ncbi:class B sortase [Turicibacter sanguinis]|nr:class B sortase [Turicibacter sanguinis]
MKKNIRVVVKLILIWMLCFSSSAILIKLTAYKKADNVYENIREMTKATTGTPPIEETEANEENKEVDQSIVDDKYDKLSSINSDYRFWLQVDNTNIDYPVVQSQDNQYYLKHDFNKNYLASGSIFMDYRNNFEEDNSVILYGHYMRNRTMFGELHQFKKEDFFNQNNLITIEYKDNKYIYEVFSTYVADFTHEDYLKINFKNEKDKKEYLNYIKNRSLYKKDIDLNANDHIITLFTCSYEFENARTIVHGKLISKQ